MVKFKFDLTRKGRMSRKVGTYTVMAVEGMSQPSSADTKREKERGSTLEEGEGQTQAQDTWARAGNRKKKGPRKLGQCLPKASVILEMTIKSEGLDAHI